MNVNILYIFIVNAAIIVRPAFDSKNEVRINLVETILKHKLHYNNF